jgi:hypothetical protein
MARLSKRQLNEVVKGELPGFEIIQTDDEMDADAAGKPTAEAGSASLEELHEKYAEPPGVSDDDDFVASARRLEAEAHADSDKAKPRRSAKETLRTVIIKPVDSDADHSNVKRAVISEDSGRIVGLQG